MYLEKKHVQGFLGEPKQHLHSVIYCAATSRLQ